MASCTCASGSAERAPSPRVDLDEVLPQPVSLSGCFQARQGFFVWLLDVGTPEQIEGPARFLEHGLGRAGHLEVQAAPLRGLFGVMQKLFSGGDERLTVVGLGVERARAVSASDCSGSISITRSKAPMALLASCRRSRYRQPISSARSTRSLDRWRN